MIGHGYTPRGWRFFLVLGLNIIWASTTLAKTTLIDDTGTQAVEPFVSMLWKNLVPQRSGNNNLLTGTTTIRVRINVLPWLRHFGRIYLALPVQPPGPVSVTWSTNGRLLPGQLTSGNRVLVYAGPITTPFMEDILVFQFNIDGRLIRRPDYPLTFHFEMDEG